MISGIFAHISEILCRVLFLKSSGSAKYRCLDGLRNCVRPITHVKPIYLLLLNFIGSCHPGLAQVPEPLHLEKVKSPPRPLTKSIHCNSKSPEIKKIAEIDAGLLPELSGMALSSDFPGRFYFHNDSGDGPYFYIWERGTGKIQRVAVKDMIPTDVEAMSYGPCPQASLTSKPGTAKANCLVLADMGDNYAVRSSITLTWIQEESAFSSPVTPVKVQRLVYPDGAKDAESFALAPNGDLYIFSKEVDYEKNIAHASRLYRLKSSVWQSIPSPPKKTAGVKATPVLPGPKSVETFTLEHIYTLKLEDVTNHSHRDYNSPTDMVFDFQGNRWLILTYKDLIVIKDVFSEKGDFALKGNHINAYVLKLNHLKQQESLGFDVRDDLIYYSSEAHLGLIAKAGLLSSPLMQISCKP